MIPSHPHTLLVTTLHCQQAQRQNVGHTLGLGKVEPQAETQTDDNAFEPAVTQSTNLTSRQDEMFTKTDRRESADARAAGHAVQTGAGGQSGR